jgi:hypothetical protein
MISLITVALLALPAIAVVAAFAIHNQQRIEAHKRSMRKNGSQIAT